MVKGLIYVDNQFNKFIKDINFLMTKLIPNNWEVVKSNQDNLSIGVIMHELEVSDLIISYTYVFTKNEVNQLYKISKYSENVPEKEKVESIKKATIAAFRKMKKWSETIDENLTQNEFVIIAINEIKRMLPNDWIVKPITLDDKIYSEINFKYNKQSVSLPIELDYIKFKRGSKTLHEVIKKIGNEGKKETMKKVNVNKNDDLFVSLQSDIDEIPLKKKNKKGKKKKKDTNTIENNNAFTQSELEKMIFG